MTLMLSVFERIVDSRSWSMNCGDVKRALNQRGVQSYSHLYAGPTGSQNAALSKTLGKGGQSVAMSTGGAITKARTS